MEEKIKRQWLYALIAYFLVFRLVGVIIDVLLNEDLFKTLAALIGSFVALGLMYYFAYHKRGTKWIGCYLLYSPIIVAVQIFGIVFSSLLIEDGGLDAEIGTFEYFAVFLLVSISVLPFMYFWTKSKKLYELNKAEKKLRAAAA